MAQVGGVGLERHTTTQAGDSRAKIASPVSSPTSSSCGAGRRESFLASLPADDDGEDDEAVQAAVDQASKRHMVRHASHVHDHVDEMRSKRRSAAARDRERAGHREADRWPLLRRLVRSLCWGPLTQRVAGDVFGIRDSSSKNRPASRLIHPDSPFCLFISCVSTVFLIYSAVLTPVLLGFYWNHPVCDKLPTLEMDMVIDAFFLLEIGVNFVTGYTSPHGVYTDDLPTTARHYATHGLAFDAITSVPVSWLVFWSLRACGTSGAGSLNSGTQRSLSITRILKPLKILKVVRILRAVQRVQGDVSNFLESELRVPPVFLRILLVSLATAYVLHLAACAWWFVREASTSTVRVNTYALRWICNDGDICNEPGFPACEMCADGDTLMSKYLLAFYFMNQIFSTVGFGELKPTTDYERLFLVLCFYIGTLVFATMLSEVQMATRVHRRVENVVSSTKEGVKETTRRCDINFRQENKMMHWLDYSTRAYMRASEFQSCLVQLPASLREAVLVHCHGASLSRVPLFRDLAEQHELGHRFLLELYAQLEVRAFPPFSRIVQMGDRPPGLCVINDGSARMAVDGTNNLEGLTMVSGDFWGESVLMAGVKGVVGLEELLAMPYHVDACTYVELFMWTPQVLRSVLKWYPEVAVVLRRRQQELLREQIEVCSVCACIPLTVLALSGDTVCLAYLERMALR